MSNARDVLAILILSIVWSPLLELKDALLINFVFLWFLELEALIYRQNYIYTSHAPVCIGKIY